MTLPNKLTIEEWAAKVFSAKIGETQPLAEALFNLQNEIEELKDHFGTSLPQYMWSDKTVRNVAYRQQAQQSYKPTKNPFGIKYEVPKSEPNLKSSTLHD